MATPLILNPIPRSDSYKVGHWSQYLPGTTSSFSYAEARSGAKYPYTMLFGLQYEILSAFAGTVVTQEGIDEAQFLLGDHFSNPNVFNRAGWQYIVDEYEGRLPLEIRALPEGTVADNGNALVAAIPTDDNAYWLGQYVESKLLHVWLPSNVATLSSTIKAGMRKRLTQTGSTLDGLDFMLHDFGYRGAHSDASAAIAGLGHLISFNGTDTLASLWLARQFYGAAGAVGYSVLATEHSVMTSTGNDIEMFDRILADTDPAAIISFVIDSYNPYKFVEHVCSPEVIAKVKARTGKVVLRPDSPTDTHPLPGGQMAWIADRLFEAYGGTLTKTGHKLLDPRVGVLWGDGIKDNGIYDALDDTAEFGLAASDFVFGMGGGLHTSTVRDTQRWAFKCSAQLRNGTWYDIKKNPLDQSKVSKAGRLKVVDNDGLFVTVPYDAPGDDLMVPVFRNGEALNLLTFDQVRENADRTGKIWWDRNEG